MARYTKPVLEPRILGSREGSTFQRTANGFVIRKRTVPTQKSSDIQSVATNRFASVSQNWRSLTPAQQATWATEAPNFPRTDSLGNSYIISNQQLQQSSNVNLEVSNQNQIVTIPASAAIPAISFVDSFYDSSGSFVKIDTNTFPVPSGYEIQVFIGQFGLPSINSIDLNFLSFIFSIPSGTPPLTNFFSNVSPFFPLAGSYVGSFYSIACQMIAIGSGQRGERVATVGDII